MSSEELEIYSLDAAYKPFPTFERWATETTVDEVRWNRYKAAVKAAGRPSPEVLRRAYQVVKRAAAIDTGAIEGLYEVDRGFTYTVAFETAAWESVLSQKGEHVRSLFEAQLHAYDYVLDLATRAEPISEAAIRALQQQICQAQATYRVMTAVGPQEQPLPKGQYKILPNHVRTRNATNHSYAPVDVTPAEMARLVGELRTEKFLAAHPVLQASYAHYALVVIHPFADGNGRVARALASAFTYRAISMPIVVLSEHKGIYLDALEAADEGNYQQFADFMLARSLDTIQLVEESIRSASAPAVGDTLSAIESLYMTKGGYTQDQVDSAGFAVANLLVSELRRALDPLTSSALTFQVSEEPGYGYNSHDPLYRVPISGRRTILVNLHSKLPAHASVLRRFALFVPEDAGRDNDLRLIPLPLTGNSEGIFTARMDQVVPEISGVLQMRASMFAERVIAEMLAELRTQAQDALRK
jgi:Fic family protein